MNFKLHKSESGFTLIELMATLAILALITVIAVPTIGGVINNAEESAEASSIQMIEKAGGIAEAGGLAHDRDEAYDVTTLVEEGYLDMDTDDILINGYVMKTGSGNAYVYNGMSEEEEVTDASIFTWSHGANGYTVTGFSDERPDDLTDIVIPDTHEGEPVVSIGSYAFSVNNLTSVSLPNTVTSVADGAFMSNNLTSVTLPDTVTSIGDVVFYGNNLTSVILPDALTSIGSSAFYGNNLTSVILPDALTSIGVSAFFNNNLTTVTLPDGLISIADGAFMSNNLTTVTLPDTLTSIGSSAFHYNPGLTIYGSAGSAASEYPLQSGQSFVEI